jgi:diguanylate cyclase (GGDEF)-like protein/PAS domain S-box-containing protein
MLAYGEINVFPQITENVPTQLWIAASYMESISLLISPIFLTKNIRRLPLFLIYTFITAFLLLSVFYWKVFPVCYIEDVGPTIFNNISEYVISIILFAGIFVVWLNRDKFESSVFMPLILGYIATIVSALFVPFYVSNYSIADIIGHILQLAAFYLIYRAIVETSMMNPLKSIFFEVGKESKVFRDYIEYAGVMFVVIDKDGRVALVNRKGFEILGYPEEEIIGRDWFMNFLPEDRRSEVKEYFMKVLRGEEPISDYYRNATVLTKDGVKILQWQNMLLKNSDGKIFGILSSAEDITEKKHMEEQLKQLATFDDLTHVYNKRAGIESLEREIKTSLNMNTPLTVIFIDVNRLKVINDTYGHLEGDENLKFISMTMSDCVGEAGIVFRFGGDEFIIILPKSDKNEAVQLLKEIENRIKAFNFKFQKPYEISVSYGIAVFDPEHPVSTDTLLATADKEMYKMKNSLYERLRRDNQFKGES